jgi:hypothetical protein
MLDQTPVGYRSQGELTFEPQRGSVFPKVTSVLANNDYDRGRATMIG